ncbi:hypothetical protein [Marinobacter halotolerans]|uniref:hypothetical protein n=1 Tax=Marinobacter halotolerans TaxID=1569211 RepID=UPI001244CD83|nr:hypothetical protein [Marinobacter halotolerans]
MKSLLLFVFAITLAGCSTQPKTIVNQDLSEGVVGTKPEGYPKTMVRALPDQPGFCVEVTQDWQERSYEGKTVWLKEKTVRSASCTKYRWYQLARDH